MFNLLSSVRILKYYQVAFKKLELFPYIANLQHCSEFLAKDVCPSIFGDICVGSYPFQSSEFFDGDTQFGTGKDDACSRAFCQLQRNLQDYRIRGQCVGYSASRNKFNGLLRVSNDA